MGDILKGMVPSFKFHVNKQTEQRGKMFPTGKICLRFRSQPIKLRKIALAKRKPANLYTNIGSLIMAEGVGFFRLLD